MIQVSVDDIGGELVLRVRTDTIDLEDGDAVVLAGYLDHVTGFEGAQQVEDTGAVFLGVDVARMIDGPTEPGAGEPLYQPAFDSGSSNGGTWTVPSGFNPRFSIDDVTLIAGIRIETGGEACSTRPLAAAVNDGSTIGVFFGAAAEVGRIGETFAVRDASAAEVAGEVGVGEPVGEGEPAAAPDG